VATRKVRRWKYIRHQRVVERKRLKRKRLKVPKEKFLLASNLNEDVILAPEVFGLNPRHHQDVARFMEQVRKAVSSRERIVCLDFRPTQKMAAGATLLLYSELHRIKRLYPNAAIRCVPARNKVVGQILQHLQIYDLLGHDAQITPDRKDVISWRTATSGYIDGNAVGNIISQLALDDVRAKHLFRGATEAMVNAINHAYQESRNDGLVAFTEKKWWMFFRQHEDKLAVAVCDLGIGIPRSLPLKYASEVIQEAMSVLSVGYKATDSRLIQAAMELQRTRTSQVGRGRGLNDLRRIVDEVPGGILYIFSNKGLVQYEGGVFTRRNFRISLFGTVVLWIIPLGGEAE